MTKYKNTDAILQEIYRRAKLSSCGEISEPHLDWKEVVEIIKEAPAIATERRRGKWQCIDSANTVRCSECNGICSTATKFCPHCGVSMSAEREEIIQLILACDFENKVLDCYARPYYRQAAELLADYLIENGVTKKGD